MSRLSDPEFDRPDGPRAIGTFIIGASLAVITAGVLSGQPLQSANDRSRWSTVWSLVERGTYQIDEIDQQPNWSTIDKVRHRHSEDEPWHFYSSKPPLLSTMVAGLYWGERLIFGRGLFHDTVFVTRVLLLLVNVIPMALALFAFRRSLRLLDVPPAAFRFLLLAAGLGSMLNPFLTTLNNHTPAAACLLLCVAAMIRLNRTLPERRTGRDFVLIGFTAALTACFELPAALFGIITFLYVLKTDAARTFKWYVPAALIPLAAFFITNWIATGGVKPFYAYYGTEKYVYVHEGIPSYWSNPQDLDANQETPLVYLFHCLLGHHGVLSLTPVYLLTIAGWWMGIFKPDWRPLRFVLVTGWALTLVVLTFYLTRTQNYNYGGNSSSLRWMLWMVPLWWYGMIPAVVHFTQQRSKHAALQNASMAILLALSVFTACWSLTQPWKPSWLYQSMENAGWIDYRTPAEPFSPPRLSVISRVPQTVDAGMSWTSTSGVATRSLTLTSAGPVTVDGREAVAVQMQLVEGTVATAPRSSIHHLVVLTAPFDSGRDVAEWLRIVDDSAANDGPALASADIRIPDDWILTLLRGMPAVRSYNAAGKRYERLTQDAPVALECDRAASRVAFYHPEFGRCWQRCDVLYCSELPFGVMKWTTTITREADNEVVSVATWLPVAP